MFSLMLGDSGYHSSFWQWKASLSLPSIKKVSSASNSMSCRLSNIEMFLEFC